MVTSFSVGECVWCGGWLHWVRGRGWVHEEGGLYVMWCPDCGWRGAPYPSPQRCPHCGSRQVRDDHCALVKAR